ncbi:type II toxin-antitoxin system HicB family antitoxin [Bacillus alkalicellulosilyticus]|uniref:type II toxin-antitoxin system HicB family antitoxin n=1 Tax=Alkalihalobacterium alkalicellulosilyticum TaxID=1912214 RepID=UPI000996CD9F|nr:hypothetical protein [Bacillus alkalicellulosilyticus]
MLKLGEVSSSTWLVRKQLDWLGGLHFVIEIKEMPGCISYGVTYKEAKLHLNEAIACWKKKHPTFIDIDTSNRNVIVSIEPPMSEEEFEYMNIIIKQWSE